MSDFVVMQHPEIDVPSGPTSRTAFEEHYSHRGWTIVDPAAVVASEVLHVGVTDLDSLKRDELVEVARSYGLDPDPRSTKAELVALIRTVAPATT